MKTRSNQSGWPFIGGVRVCPHKSRSSHERPREAANPPKPNGPLPDEGRTKVSTSERQPQLRSISSRQPSRVFRVIACLALEWLAFGVGRAAPLSAAPGVAFEQRVGEQATTGVTLRDETGRSVHFGELLGGKPAVLIFGYSRCPQLCSVVANGAVQTLRAIRPSVGRDFSVLYVSIDPGDSTRDLAGLKRRDAGRYGRDGAAAGWHCLAGTERNVRRLANSVGFYYVYDKRQKLYNHASGFVVLTSDGRIAQYFFGVDYVAKDVAAALERAAAGHTGSTVYQLLLVCARGLGISGKYGPTIWVTLEIAVIATIIAVFGGIGWMFWQERRSAFGGGTSRRGLPRAASRGVTSSRLHRSDEEAQL